MNTSIKLREQFQEYYQPSGGYRKFLLKQENLSAVCVYDYFSRLSLRANNLMNLKELKEDPKQTDLLLKLHELNSTINEISASIFNTELTDTIGVYDTVASIVEGFESKIGDYIASLGDKVLTEDATFIKRQSHVDKSDAGKNLRRSVAAKNSWRFAKDMYVKGIRKFHNSTAGKSFHRNLARYNQTRTEGVLRDDDVLMIAKGISSLVTHLIIETENRITESAEHRDNASIECNKELFRIFSECLYCLHESYFEKNAEVKANVIEIVNDFYSLGE